MRKKRSSTALDIQLAVGTELSSKEKGEAPVCETPRAGILAGICLEGGRSVGVDSRMAMGSQRWVSCAFNSRRTGKVEGRANSQRSAVPRLNNEKKTLVAVCQV